MNGREQVNLVRDFGVAENRAQLGIALHGGREIQEELRIAEQDGNEAREQLRISENRTYLECLNISERILTRYIPRGKKPLRFLNVFADELFEKRTKQSIEVYYEFLDAKISELQRRNRPPRTLKLPSNKYERLSRSCRW